jgi:hypothetical protein
LKQKLEKDIGIINKKENNMPSGKGTYGKKVGRPKKTGKKKK